MKNEALIGKPELLLEELLDASLNGIIVYKAVRDQDGRIIDFEFLLVNKAAARTMNREATDLIGKRLNELFPSREKGSFHVFAEVLETGKSRVWVNHFQHENYNNYFEVSAVPFRDGVLVNFNDITERKLAAEKMRVLERLELIVNKLPSPVSYIDRQYRFQFHNEAFVNWFGEESRHWAGKSLAENFAPEILTAMRPHLEKALGGEAVSFESDSLFLQKPDQVVQINLLPDLDEENTIRGAFLQINDVTDYVLSREEYKKAAERFNLLLDAIPGLAFTAFPDGKISYVNKFLSNFFQHSESNDWGKFIHPDDSAGVLEAWKHSLSSGEPYEKEVRWLRGDGQYRWLLSRVYPLRNQEGQPVLWIGLATDIHEQKHAYEKLEAIREDLQKSEANYRLLAESIPQLVWMTDAHSNSMYSNERWIAYTGQQAGESAGQGWARVLHPEDQERTFQAWAKALQTGETYSIEHRLLKYQTGQYRWFLSRAFPIRDQKGQILRWLGTSTDIHEQKRHRIELERKNEELNKLNSELDKLLFTAFHDLKSPLSSIEGLLNLLQETIPDETLKNPDFQQISRLIKISLSKFRQTIFEASRQEIYNSSLQGEEEVDLLELIEEIRLGLWQEISSSRAMFRVNTVNCPRIRFSRKNLRSIIYNLLSNAIKYRSAERVPMIRIITHRSPQEFVLQVNDNGIGIAPEYHEGIFSMFERIDESIEGSGLGLYIVRSIVEEAGGKIEVKSEPGKGSNFRVVLPLQDDSSFQGSDSSGKADKNLGEE